MTSLPADRMRPADRILVQILVGVTLCHLINDVIQALLPALYPMFKADLGLSFTQIGTIGLMFQVTASIFQAMIGLLTDRHPSRLGLPIALGLTGTSLLLLSQAQSYPAVLVAAIVMGLGSSIFHPEAARAARLSSGGRYGLAQSVFQVGGSVGTSLAPVLAAFVILPLGQAAILSFVLLVLAGLLIVTRISAWYLEAQLQHRAALRSAAASGRPRPQVIATITILCLLIFAKNIYTTSIQNYYTFYLIDQFGLPVQSAQLLLFLFLGAIAVGTLLGGPLTDRFGTRFVIWFSILGCLPFTLALPYANLPLACLLSVLIGLILSSAFSAIVVFGQELLPGRVGLIAGLFFGLAFGFSGIGAVTLGMLADAYGIRTVFVLCSYLPVLGFLALFLPRLVR